MSIQTTNIETCDIIDIINNIITDLYTVPKQIVSLLQNVNISSINNIISFFRKSKTHFWLLY